MFRRPFFMLTAIAFCSALILSVSCSTALADLSDLESAQQANPGLIHQWIFEGDDDSTRLADSKGSADVHRVAGEGAGNVADVTFEVGADGTSQAYRPFVQNALVGNAGAGLAGDAGNFTVPEQMTIEAVVLANPKTNEATAVNYIFQTRPGSDRGYYLIQDGPDQGGRNDAGVLGSIIGQSFGDVGVATGYPTWPSHWYYIAAVIDHDSGSGNATAEFYTRDLTANGPIVNASHTYTDNNSLVGEAGIFGIGNFAIDRDGDMSPEAGQEFFQGAIDNVAIYNTALSAEDIAANAEALGIPEPTTLVLICLGGLALLANRRR